MNIKENISEIKENIILFSLICYGFGFVFNLIYYFHFNIPIIYYLSLNDLLLFAVTNILPLVIFVFLCEYVFYKLLFQKLSYLYKLITKKDANLNWIDILSFVIFISTYCLLFVSYDTTFIDMHSLFFIFALPVCVNAKRHLAERQFHFLPSDLILIGLSIMLGVTMTVKVNESGMGVSYISFFDKDSNKSIDTGQSFDLIYIGETSTNIFLYDNKSNVSFVFSKNNITSLNYYKNITKKFETQKRNPIFIADLKNSQTFDSTNYKKTSVWIKMKKGVYVMKFNQNPKGIKMLFAKLKDLLENNNLDYDKPMLDNSYLTTETKNLDDFEKLNLAIQRNAAEIDKAWTVDKSSILISLDKDLYMIMFSEHKK